MDKIKRISAVLLSLMLMATSAVSVFAEPEETEEPSKPSEVYLENPNLEAPNTDHAEAALLMDMKTGRVIYGKNSDDKMYPASTTKMMTAILALESGMMGDTVTVPYEAIKDITLEESHMGILVGEVLTMTDLVNGMLVASANDAANVIAIHIAGSMANFVDLMNAKAAELGMKGTNFVNACGIHNNKHYTTAEDLATLARYCMENETFREIVKKPLYHIDPTNKYKYNRDLPATNMFLTNARSATHVYKPCTGIKTGTTEAAGHCLVSSALYNDMELLSVVLKADDVGVKEQAYSYTVSRALFDFGFNNYESGILASPGTIVADSGVRVAKKDKRVSLTVNADVPALVPKGDDITKEVETKVKLNNLIEAPITKGQELGKITYIYHGKEIASAPLVAANDVERNWVEYIFLEIINFIRKPIVFIPSILIIITILITTSMSRAKKRRLERRRRLQQIRNRKVAEEENATVSYRRTRNSELNHSRSKGSNSRYSSDRKDK